MPLPQPTVSRTPVHSRRIEIQAFRRDDGLWDLDALLVDLKAADFKLASGVRPAGTPVHDMRLRVTVDRHLEVVDVVAVSEEVPFRGACESIVDAYRQLIGLNLTKNFRKRVRERLGETRGCTHLSELATVLPTAAIQAFAGERREREQAGVTAGEPERQPFFIGRCHAMAVDGETVRQYHPKWYRGESAKDRAA